MKRLLLSCVLGMCAAGAFAERPNIVMLYADDLGFGSIGINGAEHTSTPHIDKLAAQGVNCTHMYSGSATCSPSRASMLTGRFPARVDIPFAILTDKGSYLPARSDYLPALLKAGGYDTAHIGKWHLGGINSPEEFAARKAGKGISDGPLEHGFDTATVMLEQHPFRIRLTNKGGIFNNGTRYLYHDNDRIAPRDGHWTTAKGDYAVEYIKSRADSDKPFFLNVWFDVPHKPIEAPPAHIMDQYADRVYTDDPKANAVAQQYCAMITHLDEQVGRIADVLKEAGLFENTLIVFSSDNGGSLKAAELPMMNLPYREGKLSLNDGGIVVPSFFVWSGHIPAGGTRGAALHQVDLLPTFCAAAGVELPEVTDGLNYSGLNVLDYLVSDAGLPERDLCFTSGAGYNAVVRGGRWKYITKEEDGKVTTELYDLQADVGEAKNLAGTLPELEESLARALDVYKADVAKSPVELVNPEYADTSWETTLEWKAAADEASAR